LRFGVLTSALGMAYLAITVHPTPALIAALTLLIYVFAYTPLKTRTGLNTFVGAVPGALPPLIGWSGATGGIEPEAWSLFLILFLWQFPHFWAIAWLYKEDYARAGMKMVPIQDGAGKMTGRLMMQNCLVLILASWTPVVFGMAGPRYGIAAVAMGLLFLATAVRFWWRPSRQRSRHVLWASLVYLPVTLLLLLVDGPFLKLPG
jgi:protoheme IX farnesyltransferase